MGAGSGRPRGRRGRRGREVPPWKEGVAARVKAGRTLGPVSTVRLPEGVRREPGSRNRGGARRLDGRAALASRGSLLGSQGREHVGRCAGSRRGTAVHGGQGGAFPVRALVVETDWLRACRLGAAPGAH